MPDSVTIPILYNRSTFILQKAGASYIFNRLVHLQLHLLLFNRVSILPYASIFFTVQSNNAQSQSSSLSKLKPATLLSSFTITLTEQRNSTFNPNNTELNSIIFTNQKRSSPSTLNHFSTFFSTFKKV
ncbi:unnamed protein product [Lathyrus oleraceus]